MHHSLRTLAFSSKWLCVQPLRTVWVTEQKNKKPRKVKKLSFFACAARATLWSQRLHCITVVSECQTLHPGNNRVTESVNVRKIFVMSELLNIALNRKGRRDRQLPDGDSQPWLTFMSSPSRASAVTWLWVKEKQFEARPLDIWRCGREPAPASLITPELGGFTKKPSSCSFPLQRGSERLCVSCHPVLIWALMYFINKGLLSSLTVVTPWFQCRMHAGRGYTINNQLAAITPF